MNIEMGVCWVDKLWKMGELGERPSEFGGTGGVAGGGAHSPPKTITYKIIHKPRIDDSELLLKKATSFLSI